MEKNYLESIYLLIGRLMRIGVSVHEWAQVMRRKFARWVATYPRLWAWSILAPLGLAIFFLCVSIAFAAVQLNYFNVISFPTSVTLEWSTASEVNLAGFDIQCKMASEPDSAFHEIGYERARGGPDVGALYSFPVTSNIVPGVAYCFRLKEITTDGSPGEVFDRCGYGPLVTPTPGLGIVPVFTPAPVQTDAFGNPLPQLQPQPVATDAFGNPLPQLQPQPVATDAFGNPLPALLPQPVATDAFGNPLPTPFVPNSPLAAPSALSAPYDPNSPLPTPYQPAAAAVDIYGNPIAPDSQAASAAVDAFGNPVQVDAFGNPVQVDTFGNPMQTDAFGNPVQPAAADAFGNPLPPQTGAVAQPGDASGAPAGAPEYAPVTTPTAAYVVVTATPTEAPVALAPVLTPLPTTTPQPLGLQLVSSTQPAGQSVTQNLMIMLLCLTFTGASGIGILGLITSVMFMRSRSSQRDFYERTSLRRRY